MKHIVPPNLCHTAHPDTKQIYTDTTPTQITTQIQVTMNKKGKENEAHHKSLCKKTQKCVEDQDQSLLMMKMDHKGGFVILGDEDSVNISKDNAVVREGLKELAANMEKKRSSALLLLDTSAAFNLVPKEVLDPKHY